MACTLKRYLFGIRIEPSQTNRSKRMGLIITATYTQAYKSVTIRYMIDDTHEFVVCGEVSDSELSQLIDAVGSEVQGWAVKLD
jgi:hypothetical protein